MGDQQGGAVVVTGETAVGQVLLYLQGKKIPTHTNERKIVILQQRLKKIQRQIRRLLPGEASLKLPRVWREELDYKPEEKIVCV